MEINICKNLCYLCHKIKYIFYSTILLSSLNFILLNKLKDDPSSQIETPKGASDSLIFPPINQRKKEKVTACSLWQTTFSS
jgi:hypothetical protein